ncbi:MAG TPA: lytic transglycosylase domain-containing protein [Aquiluna sp.]
MGRHAVKRTKRPRLLPSLGFTFVAALVMVTTIDPYSGTMANADNTQVIQSVNTEFQSLNVVDVAGTEFKRGGFELVNGPSKTKLFVELAPYPDADTVKSFALNQVEEYGWDFTQYSCLVKLWERESNWRWNALNKSSGAYGIPQSLPANKMASAGADWQTNPETQIRWGLRYIDGRYKTPCAALAHSDVHNWY